MKNNVQTIRQVNPVNLSQVERAVDHDPSVRRAEGGHHLRHLARFK